MSNNNKNKQNTQASSTPAAAAAPAAPPVESATEAAPTEPAAADTALAVTAHDSAEESGIVSTSALLQKYAKALPDHAQYLSQVSPPTKDEIGDAIKSLPQADMERMIAAFARMNPVKIGQHTAKRDFNLPDIRIFHGTGTDEQRPAACPQGGIYTTDGRILAVPKENVETLNYNPRYKGVGTAFAAFVIGVHEAGTFWPPRNAPPPEGVEVRNNVPICRTMDRQRGDYFGDCKTCTYQPFKDGKANKDACRSEDHLYVVLADFSGIYRLVVSSTSVKPGSRAVKTKSKSWSSYYEHAFDFDARANSQGTNRWYELNANVSNTPDPEPEKVTLLNALARQIDFQIYYPTLHRIYTTEPKMSAAKGNAADMDDLLKNAAGGGAPGAGAAPAPASAPKRDFSNGNM